MMDEIMDREEDKSPKNARGPFVLKASPLSHPNLFMNRILNNSDFKLWGEDFSKEKHLQQILVYLRQILEQWGTQNNDSYG